MCVCLSVCLSVCVCVCISVSVRAYSLSAVINPLSIEEPYRIKRADFVEGEAGREEVSVGKDRQQLERQQQCRVHAGGKCTSVFCEYTPDARRKTPDIGRQTIIFGQHYWAIAAPAAALQCSPGPRPGLAEMRGWKMRTAWRGGRGRCCHRQAPVARAQPHTSCAAAHPERFKSTAAKQGGMEKQKCCE